MAFDTNFRGQLINRRPQLWNSMDPENINGQKARYWTRAEVMESYQQTVKERCALIKDMHMNWSSRARVLSNSMEKIPNNELISSIARFHTFCDIDGQRVLKHDLDTKITSNIQFSNCEVLGLPYWFVCNLERVSTWGHSSGQFQEHVHQVDLLPGLKHRKLVTSEK